MSSRNLIDPKEAINRLHISYSSFLRHVKAGKIPVIRIGKQLRVSESFFEALENEAMQREAER